MQKATFLTTKVVIENSDAAFLTTKVVIENSDAAFLKTKVVIGNSDADFLTTKAVIEYSDADFLTTKAVIEYSDAVFIKTKAVIGNSDAVFIYPCTLAPSLKMMPAHKKPMPVTTCPMIRVTSPVPFSVTITDNKTKMAVPIETRVFVRNPADL